MRSLPHRDVVEWKLRYDRCPWGPKADAKRHFHIGCLTSSSDIDKSIFQMDKTYEYMERLQRDIAGVGRNEAIDKEANAQMQAERLIEMQKRHCKKR